MRDTHLALEPLVAVHRPAIEAAIRSTCARYGLRAADAEDLAHELWCSVLRRDGQALRRFAQRSSIGTYLYTIFNRTARRWITKHRILTAREIHAAALELADVRSSRFGQSEEIRRVETRLTVAAILARAPESSRRLLESRLAGMSNAEIAQASGLSPKAVEIRIARALARLKREVATHSEARTPPAVLPDECPHAMRVLGPIQPPIQ